MKKRVLISFLMTFLFFGLTSGLLDAKASAPITCGPDRDADNDRYYAVDNLNAPDCTLPLGAKGYEPTACDKEEIKCADNPEICNAGMVPGGIIPGKSVNPGVIEKANDGIDNNCDGKDGSIELIPGGTDINTYINKFINLLSSIVAAVSAAVLIWGGIMFATATGNDEKINKAKKTMVGAVIGLIVALSAWVIVGFVIEKFV